MAATTYTDALATALCDQLAEGASLRSICAAEGMPNKTTVLRWLRLHEDFRAQYVQAREDQAEVYLDEIIEIADDTSRDTEYGESGPKANSEWIARSRLRVDARKWAMSKLAPKKYGERLDLTSGDKPLLAPTIQIIAPS